MNERKVNSSSLYTLGNCSCDTRGGPKWISRVITGHLVFIYFPVHPHHPPEIAGRERKEPFDPPNLLTTESEIIKQIVKLANCKLSPNEKRVSKVNCVFWEWESFEEKIKPFKGNCVEVDEVDLVGVFIFECE